MDNVLGHKTAVAFLLSVIGLLSASLQAAVNSGNFFLDPTDLYIKKQISAASGITRLIDSNTKKLDGICSFDSDGKVDQNRAAIWNRISVKYGLGNDGASPGSIAYTEAVPAQLANADLVITQKGREVLRKSVRSLYARGTETEAGADYVDLSSLRLFVDDEDIEINLHFPTGVAMPAAGAGTTGFIYVSIDALTTRKR
jgi:hypothetical protein